MDTIWDRKSFEVGDHWPLWRDEKNRMTTQNRQKSNAKKNKKTKQRHCEQTFVRDSLRTSIVIAITTL